MYVHVVTPDQGWARVEQRGFLLMLAREERYQVIVGRSKARSIAMNRNGIVRRFRQSPPDHKLLLMLDTDVVPMGNPLDYVEDDLDVVVFPCPLWLGFKEGEPGVVWNITPLGGGQVGARIDATPRLIELERGGTGCILIARRVLEHPDLACPFIDRMNEWGERKRGHDLDFCDRVRGAGFRVWGAMQCPCSHYKEVDLLEMNELLKRAERGPGYGIVDG